MYLHTLTNCRRLNQDFVHRALARLQETAQAPVTMAVGRCRTVHPFIFQVVGMCNDNEEEYKLLNVIPRSGEEPCRIKCYIPLHTVTSKKSCIIYLNILLQNLTYGYKLLHTVTYCIILLHTYLQFPQRSCHRLPAELYRLHSTQAACALVTL
jgi:hypothetical protein